MKTKLAIFAFILITLNYSLLILNSYSQWQPDVRLTNASGESITSYNNAWCIASSGSFVHVVWYDLRDGNYEIYYKRSTDGGMSWGNDTRLTNALYSSMEPSIAVYGSLVHIVWRDDRNGNVEIYYKRSTDTGESWGTDIRLTNKTTDSYQPSIAVIGSLVQIAWKDGRNSNWEIYYKRSTDDGMNWGADTRLTNNIAESSYPSIAISGSLVNVVWEDYRDGSNGEIYYKRSTDDGINWGADIRLTNNTALSSKPSISVSGSLIHIVWQDTRDGYWEIYYKRSTDSGINWGVDTRLTNNTAASYVSSIVVSDSFVHVVWEDHRDGTPKIYYKHSADGGITWAADTPLTYNPASSKSPSVALSGSFVHVLWYDLRDGDYEIYYKRNPTGNLVGIQNISTEIPSSYSLGQNYPNPFNTTTKIRFDIKKSESGSQNSEVILKIFDMLGKEVATLVNEALQPGTYSVDWNANDYPSGVYFYRIQSGSYIETKSMTLIK